MQAFEVLWLRWLFVMIAAGLVLVLALYLGFYVTARRGPRQPEEAKPELEQFNAGIQVDRKPIPLVLILVYVGIGIFMVSYVLYTWLRGVSY